MKRAGISSWVVLTMSEGCGDALDHICGTSDFVAVGLQFACRWGVDPPSISCRISGPSH